MCKYAKKKNMRLKISCLFFFHYYSHSSKKRSSRRSLIQKKKMKDQEEKNIRGGAGEGRSRTGWISYARKDTHERNERPTITFPTIKQTHRHARSRNNDNVETAYLHKRTENVNVPISLKGIFIRTGRNIMSLTLAQCTPFIRVSDSGALWGNEAGV